MAHEIIRLFAVRDVRSKKLFVMAGHKGGIVAFGKNLEDAFDVLMRVKRSDPCIENGFPDRTPAHDEG
jgi:hypothetical protein